MLAASRWSRRLVSAVKLAAAALAAATAAGAAPSCAGAGAGRGCGAQRGGGTTVRVLRGAGREGIADRGAWASAAVVALLWGGLCLPRGSQPGTFLSISRPTLPAAISRSAV